MKISDHAPSEWGRYKRCTLRSGLCFSLDGFGKFFQFYLCDSMPQINL